MIFTSSRSLFELVLGRHQPVENLHRDRHEIRVRDPRAVMAVGGLALLVGAHLGEGGLVGGRVVLHRDLRRHAAHRECAAAVAGLDQQQRIGGEEVRPHRHGRAVGREEARVLAQPLDEREDVVPAAAVQADDVVAHFIEDLVHLERSGQRLDQDRRLDRALGQPQLLLGVGEDVVPEPRFEMALQLRQVEAGRRALGHDRLGVVEDVEAEIEQRCRHRLAIDRT